MVDYSIKYPCCGKTVRGTKKLKTPFDPVNIEELQRKYNEHKKPCQMYKEWIRELHDRECRKTTERTAKNKS